MSAILDSSVPSPPTPPPSAAFWPDPEQRVVVLRLRVPCSPPPNIVMRMLRPNHHDTPTWAGAWYNALLVIPCATFHKHIKPVDAMGAPTPIPWESWGLRGSVLIRDQGFADQNSSRGHYWQQPQFVFPFGSRLTFFARLSASDRDPRLVTLDTNPLSKLHPPHPGCTRQDRLAWVEKLDERGQSSNLKTTHPRSYYFGPTFPDVKHAMAITQNASGYAVLVSLHSVPAAQDELLIRCLWDRCRSRILTLIRVWRAPACSLFRANETLAIVVVYNSII